MAVPKESGECAWPRDCPCPYLETHTRIPDCPKWVPMGIARKASLTYAVCPLLGPAAPFSVRAVADPRLSENAVREWGYDHQGPPGRTVRHLLSEVMVLARSCLPWENSAPLALGHFVDLLNLGPPSAQGGQSKSTIKLRRGQVNQVGSSALIQEVLGSPAGCRAAWPVTKH